MAVVAAGIALTAVSLLLSIGDKKEVGGVTFDAFISETQTITTEVTEFPIEDGSIVSDHSIIKPKTLQIRAIISDTPIKFLGGLDNAADLISNVFADESSKPSKRGWEDLRDILEARDILTISTELSVFENMVLQTMSSTSDKDTGRALVIDMTFKEILTVETEERKLSTKEVEDIQKDRVKDSQDKGLQSTKNITDTSFAKSMKTSLGF